MKYIATLIVAIGFCSSFQLIAQEKNEGPTIVTMGFALTETSPMFLVTDDLGTSEITQQEFESLSNRNVQTITVLKDPITLVSFGERGRNGVVVVQMRGSSFSENFPGNTRSEKEDN
jgi:hypothetical protein